MSQLHFPAGGASSDVAFQPVQTASPGGVDEESSELSTLVRTLSTESLGGSEPDIGEREEAEGDQDDEFSEDDEGGVGFDSTPAAMKTRVGRVLHAVGSGATCCPRFLRTRCLQPSCRPLLVVYLALLIGASIVCVVAFWHVWSLYEDTSANGGCLRDDRSMNDFRFILKTFDQLARQSDIEYWADFGVLLGGVQRGDILPWDRDIDISMSERSIAILRNETTRERFRARGLFVCPYRACIRPMFARNFWPEIDINIWHIDPAARRVTYVRTEKEAADPIRDAVFRKYYDFDLDLLYPLRTLSIGSIPMSVPFDSESLLKLRYPHSYGWSLPYNPRCWWSAFTTGLPDVGAINVTTPPHVDEVWGSTRQTPPGEEPPRFLWSAERVEFVENDEWKAWQLKAAQSKNSTVVATTPENGVRTIGIPAPVSSGMHSLPHRLLIHSDSRRDTDLRPHTRPQDEPAICRRPLGESFQARR